MTFLDSLFILFYLFAVELDSETRQKLNECFELFQRLYQAEVDGDKSASLLHELNRFAQLRQAAGGEIQNRNGAGGEVKHRSIWTPSGFKSGLRAWLAKYDFVSHQPDQLQD